MVTKAEQRQNDGSYAERVIKENPPVTIGSVLDRVKKPSYKTIIDQHKIPGKKAAVRQEAEAQYRHLVAGMVMDENCGNGNTLVQDEINATKAHLCDALAHGDDALVKEADKLVKQTETAIRKAIRSAQKEQRLSR